MAAMKPRTGDGPMEAVKEGRHPREITERNIAHIKRSMRRIGWAYDWRRELSGAFGDLGTLVVAGGMATRATEQLAVDPELAGLLLGQGVGGVLDAERGSRRPAVPTD